MNTITQLYDSFASKMGKEHAEGLLSFIERKIETEIEHNMKTYATKETVASIKSDIVKWMFVFWIGQIAAMITLMLLLVKK